MDFIVSLSSGRRCSICFAKPELVETWRCFGVRNISFVSPARDFRLPARDVPAESVRGSIEVKSVLSIALVNLKGELPGFLKAPPTYKVLYSPLKVLGQHALGAAVNQKRAARLGNRYLPSASVVARLPQSVQQVGQ
jgi:hypothetical protein